MAEPIEPKVIILGGGFGGLSAAQALKNAPVRVTLIDRRNHHLFQPLLYQVATAALNPSSIASPIRRILRYQTNADVVMDEARSIDLVHKTVELSNSVVPFDFLIVATGATHAYFGRDDWEPFAPGLKTIEDALEIRRRTLLAYEAAEREPDSEHRSAYLTFVVIGAGPTGVEMAGSLIEIARHVVSRDFRHFDPRDARVVLVEAGPRILSGFDPELSAKAETDLETLGVEVLLNTRVTGIDAKGVDLGERRIEARTVVWAAGVAASPLGKTLGVPVDRVGRVQVHQDLTVPGAPEVYIIGDLAALEQGGKPLPGVAQVAIQGGTYVAKSILHRLNQEPVAPFRYHDKGSMATIGRASAVAQIGKTNLSGFIAWLAWLFVHIVFLIGFRNRLAVLWEWAWVYLTYERGARLITGRIDEKTSDRTQ